MFLIHPIQGLASVLKVTIEIRSSGLKIFYKYLNESLTKSNFYPPMLPLTSTTQTKSIGALFYFCTPFYVSIFSTTGSVLVPI